MYSNIASDEAAIAKLSRAEMPAAIKHKKSRETKLIPEALEGAVLATVGTARDGSRILRNGVGVVSDVGAYVGGSAASAIRTGVGSMFSNNSGAASHDEPNETLTALSRLTSSTLSAFTGTLSTIDESTKKVTRSGISVVGDVSKHMLGKQAGRIIDESLSVSEELFATYKAMHGINAQKLAKKMTKSASKSLVKEMFRKDEQKLDEVEQKVGAIAASEAQPSVVEATTSLVHAREVPVSEQYNEMLAKHDAHKGDAGKK
eukprot:TRINITY_DN9183_c0_g1_i1.p1 TRINITY_DN9183_c0_g1~~TRINITY_DN9183_c0_g1_i1.p1  ORF type:complete len:260 (+),score=76.45 TRINITY_DN9183_c0_g1_i1:747-1526(+)